MESLKNEEKTVESLKWIQQSVEKLFYTFCKTGRKQFENKDYNFPHSFPHYVENLFFKQNVIIMSHVYFL